MSKSHIQPLYKISLLNDRDITEEKQNIYNKLQELFETYTERIYNIFYDNAVKHDLFFFMGDFKVSCNKNKKDNNGNFLDKTLKFYGFCGDDQIFQYEINTVTDLQSFIIGEHVAGMNKFLSHLYNAIIEYNYYE